VTTTFSLSQVTTMDRHIGASFKIPACSLTVFFVGSILLTVSVYDCVMVPMARRVSGHPHGLTLLQRTDRHWLGPLHGRHGRRRAH
jgi:peptide/histidine transporter 3/4